MSKYGKSQLRLLQHVTLAAVSINNTWHWDNCNICYGPQYYRDGDKQIFDTTIVSVYSLWILIRYTLTQGIMSELKSHYWNYNINKMWSERLITSVPDVILWKHRIFMDCSSQVQWMLWTHGTFEKYSIGIYWIIQYDTNVFQGVLVTAFLTKHRKKHWSFSDVEKRTWCKFY